MKVTTKSGFSCEIDPSTLDNMELVDALAEMQGDGDALSVSRVVRMVLGDKNRKALYDHLRKEGRVAVGDVTQEVIEIFGALGNPGKNS